MIMKTEYATKEDIEKYHLDELQKKQYLAIPGINWKIFRASPEA